MEIQADDEASAKFVQPQEELKDEILKNASLCCLLLAHCSKNTIEQVYSKVVPKQFQADVVEFIGRIESLPSVEHLPREKHSLSRVIIRRHD